MKRKKSLKRRGQFSRLFAAGILMLLLTLGVQSKAYASDMESIIKPDTMIQDGIISDDMMPESEQETISIEFPVFSEDGKSPFDFILDPQGLINATNAVRYGGRSFEEGATLYFENTNGEYDFSSTSDFLTIINRSSVPVRVSVNACLDDMEKISISADTSFADMQAHLYLALVDDRGSVIPFDEEGKAQMIYEMECQDENGYAVYSFALTGACNPNADWSLISVKPQITVSWTVQPMVKEEGEESGPKEEKEVEEGTAEEEKAAEILKEEAADEAEDIKEEEISEDQGGEKEAEPEEENTQKAGSEGENTKEEEAPEGENTKEEEALEGENTKGEEAPEGENIKEEAAENSEKEEEKTEGMNRDAG